MFAMKKYFQFEGEVIIMRICYTGSIYRANSTARQRLFISLQKGFINTTILLAGLIKKITILLADLIKKLQYY